MTLSYAFAVASIFSTLQVPIIAQTEPPKKPDADLRLEEPRAMTENQALADDTIYPLNFHKAPQLDLEPVGQATTKAWYRELPAGRANDQSQWRQLIWFKKDSRTTQKSYFASVDFVNGTIRELPAMLPVHEPYENLWLDGKLYLGTNLPAHLTIYDPSTDTLTDLGPCFSDKSLTLFRMAVSPDGVLAMGGGTGSDVSLYNPKTGLFTHFGQVATKPGGGTYAYYLSIDEKYIYVAVRSSDAPQLVRLDRGTKERSVLLTGKAAQDFLSINGNVAELTTTDEGGQKIKKWYTLALGQAIERPAAEQPVPWVIPGSGFTGDAPKIAIDEAPFIAGEDALTIHIQAPGSNEWRSTRLRIQPDIENLSHIAALDDGRIVGLGPKYFAMVIVEPKSGATQRFPLSVSAYGILPVGRKIFISGYPNSRTLVFDTEKPMTWAEGVPGRPGVSQDSPAANPRLVRAFGKDTEGAHIAMLLTKGSDGNIYAIARRHRYFFGFSLIWFRPDPNEKGETEFTVFDDQGAFNHLQISGMQPVDGGKRLLITTAIEYNKQIPGLAPDVAAIFLFDVEQKKIIGKYKPVTGARKFDVATMCGPVIIGAASGIKTNATTLFKFNAESGQLEKIRHVNWNMGDNMAFQPDGSIWGTVLFGNYSILFTINPADLTVNGLGQFNPGPGNLCLLNGELYLSGAPQIRRVKGVPTPVATGQKKDEKSK